jgi:hypothetical protein
MITLKIRDEGHKSARAVPIVLGTLFPTLFGYAALFGLKNTDSNLKGWKQNGQLQKHTKLIFISTNCHKLCSILLIILTIYASPLHFLSVTSLYILVGFPWLTGTAHSSMGSELHPSKLPGRFRTPARRIWMSSQSSHGNF